MNIDGRLVEYKKTLEENKKALAEQHKIREQIIANINWLNGAIETLEALKKDDEQPIVEIKED